MTHYPLLLKHLLLFLGKDALQVSQKFGMTHICYPHTLRQCLTPVTMRFFSKKGMGMGPLEHFMLLNHVLPADVSSRKCLTPMKSALSKSVFGLHRDAILSCEPHQHGTDLLLSLKNQCFFCLYR
jgi:hypothetical protein